ncbi:hypothetical protein Cgig2_033702 [Carnegiea gigantea]|uniref:Pectinesterase inhibitor domain-containing protein n=1 Tax=Carnegiea gigantea TaxID=171969 RepID=A0A9Q1QDQ7_9CARY|nr:hypothetical protein Cgig2_033702 [Carnegiea gigantea]
MDSSKEAMELKPTHCNHLVPPCIIFSLLILASITAVQSTTLSSSTVDFIKDSCNVTRFPDLCFASLSTTYTGGKNLGTLTCAAINVSLTAAAKAADHVAATVHQTVPSSRGAAAVRDCVKLTRDAVRQLRRSLDQMMKVVGGGGMRNERRVRDGEDGGEGDGGKVEIDVSEKVEEVMKLISDALALVNSFAKDNQ